MRLAIGQALPDGRLVKSADVTVPLAMSPEQHAALLKEGVTLTATVDLGAQTQHVRVVVRDLTSGAIGSLSIPAPRLR